MHRLLHTPRLAALAVALVSTLPYLQTLGHGTVAYDDPWLVTGNHLLQAPSWVDLGRIWFDLGESTRLLLGAEFLPVRDMSVMLDFALFGQATWGPHLVNILLHALLAGAAVLVLARWTGQVPLALAAGLLFALHPLHAESVAWLSERKGLLAALFALLSTLAFHGYAAAPSVARWLLTAALLVLATWSKAVGVASLGLMAALLLLYPGVAAGQRARAWAGLAGLLAAGALAMAPVFMVGDSLVIETSRPEAGPLANLWLSLRILGLYLKHLLLIGPLGVRYEIPTAAPWGIVAGAAGALTLLGSLALVAAGVIRRGRWRLPALGAALFWAFYLPASQLIFPLQNLAADRYLLLPSLGSCLLLALPLSRLPGRRAGAAVLLGIALLAGALSAAQAHTWRDTRGLNEQALRARPGDLRALLQLSALERETGDLTAAVAHLDRAAALHGEATGVLLHRSLLLVARGDPEAAIQLLRQAARRDAGADKVRANLAILLSRQGRGALPEALRWARQAVKIRPQVLHNQRTLGVVAQAAERFVESERAFRLTLDMAPSAAGNWFNLALALANQGKRREARQLLAGALKINPGLGPAQDLLRTLEGEEGR